jgi:hypothetical protein
MQVICSNRRKPVLAHKTRGGALRSAWLRAPPLPPELTKPNHQPIEALDPKPHMRVGKGAESAVPTRAVW